jgi:hypothetical protein
MCREGVPGSALALRRGASPAPDEWQALASCGLTLATDGRRYLKSVTCPVNGDGYEYWRIELLDSSGNVVGSREVNS